MSVRHLALYGALFTCGLFMALSACSPPSNGGGNSGDGTSGGDCVGIGASCADANECCPGLACVLTSCQPDVGADVNGADCAGLGAACTDTDDCCLGLACTDGACAEFPEDFTMFEVTLQERARVISEETLAAGLLEASHDLSQYHFALGTSDIADLVAGDVVLFAGLSLRRVTDLSEQQGRLVVTTEPATLTDLVQEGNIAWQQTIDIDALPAAQVDAEFQDQFLLDESAADAARRLGDKWATSAKRLAWSGTVNGWETSFTLEPTDRRLDFEVSFSRAVGGIPVVALAGKGWVAKFRQHTTLRFKDGRLMHAEAWTEQLRGETEITWAAANTGEFIETEFTLLEIPVSFPYTILVGPVPVTITLKASGRLNAQLNFANMASRGSLRVRYGSSQGFVIEDTSLPEAGAAEELPDCSATGTTTVSDDDEETPIDGEEEIVEGEEGPLDGDVEPADGTSEDGSAVAADTPECIAEDTAFSRDGGATSSEFAITGDTVSAGSVTVGFGAGVEFPRIELTLAGSATGYVSVDTAVSGFFEPGLFSGNRPCQWSELTVRGIAGYDLSILGHSLLSGSEELWRRDYEQFAGGEPCNQRESP